MCLAVDPAAAVGEDVQRLVGLDEHAGALEHLERGEVDVVELRLGEDAETQAAAARTPGMQVAFHAFTSVWWPAAAAGVALRGPMWSQNFWTAVDGHVEHLADVELGLDGARFVRVGELLHAGSGRGPARGARRA